MCNFCPKVDTSGKILYQLHKNIHHTRRWQLRLQQFGLSCYLQDLPYVGETSRTLKQRFYEHFYYWRNLKYPARAPPGVLDKKTGAAAKHFCLNGHCLEDVKIQILEFIRKPPMLKSTMKYRNTRELYWIYQLKTLEPMGLNNILSTRYLPVFKILISDLWNCSIL